MPKRNLTHSKQHKSSGYRGVYKTSKGWISKISIKGIHHILGPFKTEKESAEAYDKKALEAHRERAVLNILKNPFQKIVKKVVRKKQPKKKSKEQNKKSMYIHKRAKFSVVTRNKISARQKWRCNFCNECLGSLFIVDHIVPLFLGGSNGEFNLQSLCPECDRFKTSIIDYQILKPLSETKVLTTDDVLKAQEDNYHRMMCIDPSQPSPLVSNNINCQQYITNSNISGSGALGQKEVEINVNGVKIKILA